MSIINQLAEFAVKTDINKLSPAVIVECKRDILDAIGCALASINQPKADKGIADFKTVMRAWVWTDGVKR